RLGKCSQHFLYLFLVGKQFLYLFPATKGDFILFLFMIQIIVGFVAHILKIGKIDKIFAGFQKLTQLGLIICRQETATDKDIRCLQGNIRGNGT
ncbi:MAG: hypothetical protein NC121_20025, partial [Blautia sp.]|nr:hypothetical protein [Blautia sp.]